MKSMNNKYDMYILDLEKDFLVHKYNVSIHFRFVLQLTFKAAFDWHYKSMDVDCRSK